MFKVSLSLTSLFGIFGDPAFSASSTEWIVASYELDKMASEISSSGSKYEEV